VSFYVTTPIFYVNAAPHLGHAYTAIGADVLARHRRQRGEEVFFLTGTDEHGEPVALAAEREGVTPQELADRNAERFRALMPQLNVSNDFFIRTTDPEHVARVQQVLTRVRDNGHVYKGVYEGWYCPRCADFKTEAEAGEEHRCPIHRIELSWEQEENWFFRLSAFQGDLERLYDEHPDFVQPRHRFNEARSFIASGLQDVSLTRARLRWGVPVPWDEGQVFYVWFDALLNYYTALGYARDGHDLTDVFWPASVHLIGKDILKFHCVFWPALLLAAGLPLPEGVFVHGFLLMRDASGEESKMSKSLGNVLDPFQIIEEFGADALRHYCLREVSFGQDGAVSTAGFGARYENELANEYGNLVSRTLAMVHRYRDGDVPAAGLDELGDVDGLHRDVPALMDVPDPSGALDRVWRAVRALNRYVEERAPWALAKDPARSEELDRTLASLAEGLRVVTVWLHPFIPASSERVLAALGAPDLSLERARPGQGALRRVERLPPLFPKPE
jgi:methionyl-tRNA synthetase